jgi:hypothetical protein
MTVPLPQAVRAKLNERADRLCEVRLPGCYINANNAHHRKNQSQGGLDVLSNLLLACGSGTTGCHGWITEHPGEAKRRGLSVWRSDDPALTPVMYRGAWARLDNTGLVHLLKRGEVRNELGHLSITDERGDVRGQYPQRAARSPQDRHGERTRIL